jgi:hypothetical protein
MCRVCALRRRLLRAVSGDRPTCYRASLLTVLGSDLRRLAEGRGVVAPPMAFGRKFAPRRAA